MSAPESVRTKDGITWTLRTVTSSGIALYAPKGVCECPDFVMATLSELAEHGIQSTELAAVVAGQGALPVPVGPVPQPSPERDRLRAAFIEALDNAARTHPCPALGDQIWSGCAHYDEAGHVSGVGSCHSERRADAVLAVRDVELETLRARVAGLEADLATANGVLDDAAEVPDRSVEESAARLSRFFSPMAVLREASSREEPHDSPLHQAHRTPHDMPEGCRLSEEQVRELGNHFLGGGAS